MRTADRVKPERTVTRAAVAAMAVAVVVLCATATPAAAQVVGENLFPTPFLVEHYIVQTGPDGGVFATEPVLDHYGDSLIVSLRNDGSRLIVDHADRTITEIRPDHGTYNVLTFDQLVELQRRLRDAERAQVGLPPNTQPAADVNEPEEPEPEPEFAVTEAPLRQGVDPDLEPATNQSKSAAGDLLDRPGVRHLRVTLQEDVTKSAGKAPAVDVWVDGTVRLGPAAIDALNRFEAEVLASGSGDDVPFSRFVAAARLKTGGAFPIRTSRPLASSADRTVGSMDDIAIRLEPIPELTDELKTIPEGFKRSPHPLEQMVAFAEEEAELNLRALRATAAAD